MPGRPGPCAMPKGGRFLPETSVVLEDVVTAEVQEGEGGVRRVVRGQAQLHEDAEEKAGDALVLVRARQHAGDEVCPRDVLAAVRQESVVGQGVESWAGSSHCKQVHQSSDT